MKRLVLLVCCFTLLVCLAGCARAKKAVPFGGAEPGPAPQAEAFRPYSGPKAKITVADFDIKAAKATNEAASGLRQMLVSALKTSDRFLIVEPQELNMAPAPEAGAGGQADTKAADLIIALSVVEFEPQASGGSAGVGGGGGVGSGALGGLLNTNLNKACIALDVRLIDAETSHPIAAARMQGQASDIVENFAVPLWEKGALSANLATYINTPMEKAIRTCMEQVIRYIPENIKQEYYKY